MQRLGGLRPSGLPPWRSRFISSTSLCRGKRATHTRRGPGVTGPALPRTDRGTRHGGRGHGHAGRGLGRGSVRSVSRRWAGAGRRRASLAASGQPPAIPSGGRPRRRAPGREARAESTGHRAPGREERPRAWSFWGAFTQTVARDTDTGPRSHAQPLSARARYRAPYERPGAVETPSRLTAGSSARLVWRTARVPPDG